MSTETDIVEPTAEAVTAEIVRIKGLFSVTMDDKEDLISYAKIVTKLRAERDDLKADYLRRHNDACDYWLVLKRIADGYGPDHLSKACRDWAQFAIDEAHRRTDTVIATDRATGKAE